jgi:hypothetical protein
LEFASLVGKAGCFIFDVAVILAGLGEPIPFARIV